MRGITTLLVHQLLTVGTVPLTLGHCGRLPIAAQKRILDWLPIALALLPALPLAVFYIRPATWPAAAEFECQNWGDIASVWGLCVSIGVLFFARGARQAAQDAKKEIRRRSLAEELHDAHSKAREAGRYMRDGQWDILYIRAQEISGACSVILSRWAGLAPSSKGNIALAREQASSIERFAMSAKLTKPTPQQILTASAAQRRLHELLGAELGDALATVEGT